MVTTGLVSENYVKYKRPQVQTVGYAECFYKIFTVGQTLQSHAIMS
jgi:hypothetical protein